MADLLYPPWLRTSRARFDFISNTEISRSIFNGVVHSNARSGDRVRATLTTNNASDRASVAERATLKALYGNLRGQANRIWIADPSYTPRGSFPASEVLTNNTFASGTSGWASSSANITLSANDRILRATRGDVSSSHTVRATSFTATDYAVYAFRAMILAGRGVLDYGLRIGTSAGGSDIASLSGLATQGLTMVSGVAIPGNTHASILDSASGRVSGDFYEVTFASCARCILIDNSPNLLQYSDQLDNAAWTKTGSSIVANGSTAPDGSTTGDRIVENTSTSAHQIHQYVTVPTAAADYSAVICVKAVTRTWCEFLIYDATTSSAAGLYVNLSTGAKGTEITNVNWSNLRTFVTEVGGGWYRIHVVALKAAGSTSVGFQLRVATGDGVYSYTGDGASYITAWRGGLAQSSVPFLPSQTTTTATTGTSQTANKLYVKGLPVSTTGLLLPGDWVQIGSELNMVVAPLNSNAAGLGYLQLYRPPRSAPADNDPVIVNTPMGRFIATSNEGGWDDSPGLFSNFEREFEESLDQ